LAGLIHDIHFVQTFIPEEIMRESSVVKEIIKKERIQDIISVLEVRFGEIDDTIEDSLGLIQDDDTLNYLLRRAVVAEKDEIEKKIFALSA
jgi:hypothetical protein